MLRSFFLFIFLIFSLRATAFEIESFSFKNGSYIPKKYTCAGKDISPHFLWRDIPSGTKSLVLICDDPDAPFKTWVHWVIFNIPADVRELPEGVSSQELKVKGIIQGRNDFGNIGYGGPCPPPGKPHRYFFKLYALDSLLSLEEGASKQEVLKKMQGHIIEKTEIMGLFKK